VRTSTRESGNHRTLTELTVEAGQGNLTVAKLRAYHVPIRFKVWLMNVLFMLYNAQKGQTHAGGPQAICREPVLMADMLALKAVR